MNWFKWFYPRKDKTTSHPDETPNSENRQPEDNITSDEISQMAQGSPDSPDLSTFSECIQPSSATDAEAVSLIDDRHIRVFVSSTFKDMHKEREILVKQVFPELRRICAERFVTFTEVDLRWGITEEQAAEGKVLPICLEEIHRTRPYFIGILGERYGWIPDSVPQEVIAREPWLAEHVAGRTSVTELEILHGVLNNPDMADHSFFFFRDPAYVNTIPAKDRRDFIVENPDAAEKLNRLKDKIRNSGFPVFENYADPNVLADAVREQFTVLIDSLYPKESVPDPLDQEAMGHEAYGRGKLLAYVERPEHTAALEAFAVDPSTVAPSTGQGLVLTGDSGCGKTALLASWVRHWKEAHPEDFVFVHYFGATPESASVPGFLRRILGELKRRFEIHEEIPTDPDKLAEALPLWLAQTVGKGRIILLLDALNQIEGNDPDRQLAWLPRYFPDHVRVIASALAGPALDALKKRGWIEHILPLVNLQERSQMIQTFLLGHYRKALRSDLNDQLADAPGSANPLFLRTVLEELRQFGSFEQLPDRVAHYLEAGSLEELFRRVLRRWQDDFGNDLVCHALRYLWAARQGLSEPEWLDLLGTGEQALPRQVWTPLFLAMEPHLSQRSGLWAYGHDFLRQATKAEFLPSDEECHSTHLALADYFEHQVGMTPRKATEWPWQLHAAESWSQLETCLTDKDIFLALYNERTKWELTGYWHPLRTRGASLGERYIQAFDSWIKEISALAEDVYVASQLGSFLHDNGCYSEAEPLLRHALEGRERVLGKDHSNTLSSVNNLALLLYSKGDYATAEPLYRRALEGQERVLGEDHPDTLMSVNNLAGLLDSKGDYEAAETLYRRALEGCERVMGKEHPDTLLSVNNLAGLLNSKGDYAAAEPLYLRALEGRERVLGKDHPNTFSSVNNLAGLLDSKGDYEAAETLYRRALEGRERVLGKDHPNTLMSVNNLAGSLYSKGDYEAAETLYRRALEGCERVLGKEHPYTLLSVNNLAELLSSKGDYEAAEPLYRRTLEDRERVMGKEHPDTLTSVNNLAALLSSKGDYEAAETLYRRALEGRERVLGKDHPDTLMSVNNLAALLKSKGDYKAAEPLYHRALEGQERVLGEDHPDTLMSVNNLAALLKSKGDYKAAEPLYRRALEGRERVLGKDHPDTLTSVNNLAELLDSKGDYAAAEPLYLRALEGQERVLGKDHPDTLGSVNNLAELFRNKGDYAAAEQLHCRALEGRERVLGKDHPDTLGSVNNLAALLCNKGDYAAAEPLYRRALEGCERVLGKEHPYTLLSVNNLAGLLNRKGDYAAADPLYRRALEGSEGVLGKDHPHTLTSVSNLAVLLDSRGDYAAAEPLYRRALEGFERVLGKDHPETLMSVLSLAILLDSKGDYEAAESLYRRALIGLIKMSRAMRREHPHLQVSYKNWVGCLKDMGFTEAEINAKINAILE